MTLERRGGTGARHDPAGCGLVGPAVRLAGADIGVEATGSERRAAMRVLALDYGSARCGCALSDPTGTIVTPIEPILRPGSRAGMAALVALIAEREADCVLVGLPLSLRGEDTEQTRETRAFAAKLSARLGEDVALELYDERFTTRIAAQSAGTASSEDSRAAAVLLEDWLARKA